MSNESPCQLMAEVATSSFLRTVLSVTTFLCFLCVPISLYFLWILQKSMKLHFNSKCIFMTHNMFILIHVTVRIMLHGKDLMNYYGPWFSGCEIFPSRTRCEFRLIYKFSAYVIEVTPFIFTAERFVATFKVRHYENHYKWLGVSLTLVHVSLAYIFVWFQKTESTGDVIVYYCWLSSTRNRYMLNIPIYFVVSSQFITIPTLLFLLKKNERYRETSLNKCATLTQRYQIFENLSTLNIFRIISILTWIYVTYNALASFVIHFFLKDMSMPGQFASMEIVHCIPIYYLILTVLIFREERKPGGRHTVKVDTYQPQYFDGLQKFFDDAYNRVNENVNSRA